MKLRRITFIGLVAPAIVVSVGVLASQNRPPANYAEFAKLGVPREVSKDDGLPVFVHSTYSFDPRMAAGELESMRPRFLSWDLRASKATTDAAVKQVVARHSGWQDLGKGTGEGNVLSEAGIAIKWTSESASYYNVGSGDRIYLETEFENGRLTQRTLTVYREDPGKQFRRHVRNLFRLPQPGEIY
jgi:hypothetical protein